MKTQRRGQRARERIKQYIANYTAEHGYPPCQREIAAEIGLSIVSTNYHIARLVREGEIATIVVHGRNIQRSYKLCDS